MAAEPVISAVHLRKAYGNQVAVDDISLEVYQGEIFGLLGSNGAGKTTTVECLEGLREPDQGRARVFGLDPRTQSEALRGRVGCQLQESLLPDRMRVWEALDLFAATAPRPVEWQPALALWGLADKRTSAFASLSGGERQRLLVAIALVSSPEVVFLDEMTTGLDPAARRATWELIETIRDRGTTVVLVTHFMDEAERLCDRIAVMDRGRVVALGTPSALIAAHAGSTRVTFSCDGFDVSWLKELPAVAGLARRGRRIEVSGEGPLLSHVAVALSQRGIEPLDLQVQRPTLEDTFLGLTGHKLEV